MQRRRLLRGAFFGAVAFALAACSSSDSPTNAGDGSDFEGFWRLTIDVTEAYGDCAGEENEAPSVKDVLITQEGSTITATAMWTSESGSVSLTGSRSGDRITFSGSYSEDGGTTTTMHALDIEPGTLSGREDWSWIGTGMSGWRRQGDRRAPIIAALSLTSTASRPRPGAKDRSRAPGRLVLTHRHVPRGSPPPGGRSPTHRTSWPRLP